tara:strand:+ start:1801 stop:2103 length:303 start_codon:yes stop_codon:yes gene_type:complete
MKYFNIILLLATFILFNHCQGLRDSLEGKNIKTTDEFLVKKKDPLILPPDYDKLPMPNSEKSRETKSLQSVFKNSEQSDEKSGTTSELEKIILKELKKNQ